jgi:vacuolar-type H+-ATPase subunit E/Vma4
MRPSSILATLVLSAVLSAGCDKAIDDQMKANNSQNEANEKIAAAGKEAERKGLSAQAEADKRIAQAYASFMKLREDYRHQTANSLVDLDHKVDLLEANARGVPSKIKPDIDANLRRIHAMRTEFDSDYSRLESASATTWDDAKARLDKELADLKSLVDKA